MRGLLAILLAIGVAVALVRVRPSYEFVHTGETMGTTYTVKCITTEDASALDALKRDVVAALDDVNQLMSTYRPDSDLSRLNDAAPGEWVSVDSATVTVVRAAIETCRETGGAFDPTVGPLVNLWGFGPPDRVVEPPPDAAVAEARGQVGIDRLHVRGDPPALQLSGPGMYVDLSAIAKGYAVDRVADLLVEAGIEQYMVEVGGEVRVGGRSLRNRPWRLGVERPGPGGRAVHTVLGVEDASMATSGTYRNYFDSGGRRYSHTIDPRTGWPVTHDVVSATVLHASCMMADAYATGMIVLGVADGIALAERLGLAVLLIEEKDGATIEHRSTRFVEQFGEAAS